MPGLRQFAAIATVAGGLAITGCELPKPPPAATTSPHGTAVIDLDAIAKALGRDITLRDQLTSASEKLNTKVTELASGLRNKLAEEKGKLGEAPSAQEQQKFQKIASEAQQQLRRGQALARQRAQLYQAQLVSQFRAEVLPVAQRIAVQRGAGLVLIKANLLWHDPSTDITQSVITAMHAMATTPPTSGQPQSGG